MIEVLCILVRTPKSIYAGYELTEKSLLSPRRMQDENAEVGVAGMTDLEDKCSDVLVIYNC